jgi:hypothetical protein
MRGAMENCVIGDGTVAEKQVHMTETRRHGVG